MSSPALSGLRSSLVNFTGMYLGMPADLVNQISDPKTKAPRNIILRDFLLDNGRMFTGLNETQRKGVSRVFEGFNSFFVDSSNDNPPISFSPDFRTVFEQSDIRQDTAKPEPQSFALINNGFDLNIPTEKFTPLKGEAFPEIPVELQSAFSNETVQTIVQGLLENHEIRARFLEDSSLASALQNSVLNVIGVTEGRNQRTTLAGSATDLLLSNLQQTNQRIAISIVRTEEGQGNPNVTAMVKASMEAGGADADTLKNIGDFNFHTEVIQGTPNDKNRIQFVPFNPTEEEKFKSQFAKQGPLDPSIIRKNANLTRVSVPEFAFQKVMFNFNNLFNTPEGNKFLTRLEGSTPEPYKDIVKILATEMGEGKLVGGRRYTESGKEYIESGMSLFGLNQISVLYQATKAIVEAEGTDAGLQFLKEIHDRYQRTDNEGDKPSVFAYVNNEGEFLYMAKNEQTPVFLGGENRSVIQQETQDFIDNILFTTSRIDIPVSQLGGSRYYNFRTYNERKKQEKAKEELRKMKMMSRGAHIPS
jgi:hypothetical protein